MWTENISSHGNKPANLSSDNSVACVAYGIQPLASEVLAAEPREASFEQLKARETSACRITWLFLMPPTFHTLLKPIVATNQSKGVMQNPHVSIPILRANMQLCLI